MADIYYDFNATINGTGAADSPRNAWATPGNNDRIFIRRGCTWLRSTQLNLSTFTNLSFNTYYNSDGTDDVNQPKPIIQHRAASTFVWNFQGDGIHTIKNLVFKSCGSNLNGAIIGLGLVAASGRYASILVEQCEFYDINYNAIRASNSNTANAPNSVRILNSIFDRIGEDTFFGGALIFEYAYNRVTNISFETETGDGVGFVSANPTLAWIHDNFIDHSTTGFKHCIIIDTETVSQGFALIENNTLIGPVNFGINNSTLINVECKAVIRKNTLISGRVAINLAGNNSSIHSNLLLVAQIVSAPVIALQSNNNLVFNNTIIATGVIPLTSEVIVQAALNSGTPITNNIFMGFSLAVKSDNAGDNPVGLNNCFYKIDVPYNNSTTGVYSGTNDIFVDPS